MGRFLLIIQLFPLLVAAQGPENTASPYKLGAGVANVGVLPRLFSVADGSSSNFVTDSNTHSTTANFTKWVQTEKSRVAGQGVNYVLRSDAITKSGMDVMSTIAGGFYVTAHSTNSGGNFDETNAIGVMANSSAPDPGSSVSVFGLNAVAASGYKGTLAQYVVGAEIDNVQIRDGGPHLGTGAPWGVGLLIHNNSFCRIRCDATYGVLAEGLNANNSYQFGIDTGARKAAFVASRHYDVTPDVALWANACGTWCIYLGPRNIESGLDPTEIPAFDSNHVPSGPALEFGERATNSAGSLSERFSSRDKENAQHTVDFYTDSTNSLNIQADGVKSVILTSSGNLQTRSHITPIAAGNSTLGAPSLPWGGAYIGQAADKSIQLTGTATSAQKQTLQDATGTIPLVIASGTSTLETSDVLPMTCAKAITSIARNTAATDTITWSFSGAPGAGYTSGLVITSYVTPGNVNFMVCNPTAKGLARATATLNWRVLR